MASAPVVISVENLSKSYQIGHQVTLQESFREMLSRKAHGLLGNGGADPRNEIEEFWALKDVSFEVRQGEVMGVIGRNGAGKSTLLKVLSRITSPTQGRVRIRGHVASLLEVGTGFHPELTGRENIYLNGSILGMTRRDIDRRFDEIVDFAEVERFLDTPVKRYSSGMYVRLAFAVASHMEPEILVIDEVLAVGDLVFQKKCLGKMQSVADHGRTVVFVSHNIPVVVDLTDRTVMLEAGRVAKVGETREVVGHYLRSLQQGGESVEDLAAYRESVRETGYVDIAGVRIAGQPPGQAAVPIGGSLDVELELTAHRVIEQGIISIGILNNQFETIATVMSSDNDFYISLQPGTTKIKCRINSLPLVPGSYLVNIGTALNGGSLPWDTLKVLPGFSVDGSQHASWIREPDRSGPLFMDNCNWAKI